MKIRFVVNGFPLLSERFIYLQMQKLADFNYEVVIFNLGRFDKKLYEKLSVEFNWSDASFVNIGALPNKNRVSFFKAIVRTVAMLLSKKKRMFFALVGVFNASGVKKMLEFASDTYFFSAQPEVEVIHSQFLTLANRVATLKKYGFISKKMILISSVRGYDITKRYYVNRFDKISLFENVSALLPVCQYLERLIMTEGYKGFVEVVPSPALVSEKFTLPEKSLHDRACLQFVSVGRLTEKKGFDCGIAGLSYLKMEGYHFHYTIIGEGERRKCLAQQVKTLGLDQEVTFTGALMHADVIQKMANADIVLVPSKKAANGDSEGIPNVIKEALMVKTLVVASDHAGIPEVIKVGSTGYVFSEGSSENAYNVLKQALRERGQWEKYIDAGYELVQREYSVSAATIKLDESYRKIISGCGDWLVES